MPRFHWPSPAGQNAAVPCPVLTRDLQSLRLSSCGIVTGRENSVTALEGPLVNGAIFHQCHT